MVMPLIVSTWSFGQASNRVAWPILAGDGTSLDAVIAGAKHAEDDLSNHTVGTGGYPDAAGQVTCDAAVMLSPSEHGAAACVFDVRHPVLVARDVMRHTPHRLLVGERAVAFARLHGHARFDQLTPEARQAFENWKVSQKPLRLANLEDQIVARQGIGETNHDTIGLIAIDRHGTLATAVTTSGLAFKLPGRVGDSPIVGAGLYCVPGVGAAVCTGRGELVQGVCGSFLAVELMRMGKSPHDAAAGVIARIRESHDPGDDDQVGIIVMNHLGIAHACCLLEGFKWSIKSNSRDEVMDASVV